LDKRRNICQPNNDIQHLHRRRAIASAIAVAENARQIPKTQKKATTNNVESPAMNENSKSRAASIR